MFLKSKEKEGILQAALIAGLFATVLISSLNFVCHGSSSFLRLSESNLLVPLDWTCQKLEHMFITKGSHTKESLLLQGFALPLFLISCATFLLSQNSEMPKNLAKWKPTWHRILCQCFSRGGDPDVTLWTALIVGLPALLVMLIPQLLPTSMITRFHAGESMLRSRTLLLASPAGNAAVMALSFFLIPVTKHSPLMKLFGLSFTQALVFHRLAGWISFWCTLIHSVLFLMAFTMQKETGETAWKAIVRKALPGWNCWRWDILSTTIQLNSTCYNQWWIFCGVLSTLAFVVLAITSIHRNRRIMYRFFYLCHIPCAWIMLLAAIAHIQYVGLLLTPNILYYLVSTVPVWVHQLRAARKFQGYQLESYQNIPNSNGCFELRFPHNCDKEPPYGEVCKICVPEISAVWHPFSAFRDFKDSSIMVCLIRASGPFTKALSQNLGRCQSRTDLSLENEETSDESTPLLQSPPVVLMDGPYPAEYRWQGQSLSHDTVLFVAGGVGIVPFLHMMSDLPILLRNSMDPLHKLRKVTLHWYCREVGLAKHVISKYFQGYRLATQSMTTSNSQVSLDSSSSSENTDIVVMEMHLHITSYPSTNNPLEQEALVNEIRAGTELLDLSVQPLQECQSSKRLVSYQHVALQKSSSNRRWPVFLWYSLVTSTGYLLHWWFYQNVTQHNRVIIPRIYVTFLFGFFVVAAYAGILWTEDFRKASRSECQEEDSTGPSLVEESTHGTCEMLEESQHADNGSGRRRVLQTLSVLGGRPAVSRVVESVASSENAGAFFCGPSRLRTRIKGAIKKDLNKFCAIYDEESEM